MRRSHLLVLTAVACGTLMASIATTPADGVGTSASTSRHRAPMAVTSRADAALLKLDADLRAAADTSTTSTVPVFLTVTGSPRNALALLRGGHSTKANADAALVTGRIAVNLLTKLASLENVVAVHHVTLTPDPASLRDPIEENAPTLFDQPVPIGKARADARARTKNASTDVPYARNRAPQRSKFDQYKTYDVLDARTHNFTDAWNSGFEGQGSTVAILDGGTDWSHPDLLGVRLRTRPDGWPEVYDPYGVAQWLFAPDQVFGGLSTYVPTTALTSTVASGRRQVSFATRTGPSRNFDAPDGTNAHVYTFPASWSKSGTVMLGSHPDDYALAFYGERPAFLVADPHKAGNYDTIYVDLDDDYDFTDEKPVTRSSPRSWRDLDDDGYTDLSGGMAYYISNGSEPVPGGLTSLGMSVVPPAGALVAWTGDFDPVLKGHGTLTASNLVGQGVVDGDLPRFSDLPHGHYPAAVVGGAPKATAVPFGNMLFAGDFGTHLAIYLANEAGVDVASNSWQDPDPDALMTTLDPGSQEIDLIESLFARKTTLIFISGNQGPGSGSVVAPAPSSAVVVGASSLYGGTGDYDSIDAYSQVTDNDVVTFSDRGPARTGAAGIDLVADGDAEPGSVNLGRLLLARAGFDPTTWASLDSRTWDTWGGTSRSAPVAAGAAALVYQAYRATHRGPVPPDFVDVVKGFLKSGAQDLGYDAYSQGAGSLDAGAAVRLARGNAPGVRISPDEWQPGGYRGTSYEAFPNVVAPGQTVQQSFALNGTGSYHVSDRIERLVSSADFDLTTAVASEESTANSHAPNYLVDVTHLVREHQDADLMVVRATIPYSEFDPTGTYLAVQQWNLGTYAWTDRNHDGRLWTDLNHNGTVNFTATESPTLSSPPLDYTRSEIEPGESERLSFGLSEPTSSLVDTVRAPASRGADGIFVGLEHQATTATGDRSHVHVTIEFYKNVDWSWVTEPSSATGSFTATLHVPTETPYGMYEGALVVSGNGQRSAVPIAVTVAADAPQDADGSINGTLVFGGPVVDGDQRDRLYDNGSVTDSRSWGFLNSGDWRTFYLDVADPPPPGSKLLAVTEFDGPAPPNDLDTLIFGPAEDSHVLLGGTDPYGAPYALGVVGRSTPGRVVANPPPCGCSVSTLAWEFRTATGTNRELVAAPATAGLHAVAERDVNASHDNGEIHLPFTTTLSSLQLQPSEVEQESSGVGSFDLVFRSGIDLPALVVDAFGLSRPSTTTETVHQDDPSDITTSSVRKSVRLQHAGSFSVAVDVPHNDVDLYVLRDANGDGEFTLDELVGSSTTATGQEQVTLTSPPDGDYQVWVHGFAVDGAPGFPLTITAVQGTDLTVSGLPSGPVPANTPVTLHVTYASDLVAGDDYSGVVRFGLPDLPDLADVPITIHAVDDGVP